MTSLEPQGPQLRDVTNELAGVQPLGVLMGKPVINDMCAKADIESPRNEVKPPVNKLNRFLNPNM